MVVLLQAWRAVRRTGAGERRSWRTHSEIPAYRARHWLGVYPAAEITAPGCIRHIEGNQFSLAEIDNSDTPRISQVSEAFRRAGFKAPVVSDLRTEIWTKLWGNLSFNPISALTHATLEDLCRYPLTRKLAAAMMAEAQAIGESLGDPLSHLD